VEPSEETALLANLADGDRAAAEALSTAPTGTSTPCYAGSPATPTSRPTSRQETYRRAWTAIGSFDGRSQFGTWLYRIATNTFLNHVRRPRPLVPLDDELGATLPDGAPRQDDEAIQAQTQERLRKAVLGLPEELRFTVAARYWAEAPVAEIAKADGISEVAVRKRLKHAFPSPRGGVAGGCVMREADRKGDRALLAARATPEPPSVLPIASRPTSPGSIRIERAALQPARRWLLPPLVDGLQPSWLAAASRAARC